ncbi:hypothetical protein [Falsirhodobacter sp. 20TX0035]|uniref:hypothetical protein n=1 Tax=Falsirhodobacter sp. 20TX0035 TaxID=3022019 RepID=UPI00232F0102|nr:hypothetical protein [Falsirhodobacter sp. 20TX0035]MDB6455000.1 hypothetical protein [Falsirhodobacter sp. 20TX0035]
MSSIAERKRRKKARIAGFDLAPVPRREKQAREKGRFVKAEEDPRNAALNIRCIRFGLSPNRSNRHKVSGQHMACDIGFVLEARCGDAEVSRLWQVWQSWGAAERTYRLRYLGQSETAQSSAIAMVPEPMQADDGHSVDTRTPDERDRDAVNGWMRWRGYLGHLSSVDQAALHAARRETGPALWQDGNPTGQGIATLDALRHLADMAEKG